MIPNRQHNWAGGLFGILLASLAWVMLNRPSYAGEMVLLRRESLWITILLAAGICLVLSALPRTRMRALAFCAAVVLAVAAIFSALRQREIHIPELAVQDRPI